MKKTFLILAIACIALLMSSCQKEGVYNPNKKISKIYTTITTNPIAPETPIVLTPKYLSESWTWNGKLLEKIDYYSENSDQPKRTVTFTYDSKKRVSAVNTVGSHAEYTYDGKELSEAKYYVLDNLYKTYKFTHSNGKISEIKITTEDIGIIDKNTDVNLMQFVLPLQICQAIDNAQKESMTKSGIKGSITGTTTFTWEKGNITQSVYKDETGYEQTFTGEYDQYKNPYYGMFEEQFYESNLSKNNLYMEHYRDNNGGIRDGHTNYEFGSEHLYPIKASHSGGSYYLTVREYEYK